MIGYAISKFKKETIIVLRFNFSIICIRKQIYKTQHSKYEETNIGNCVKHECLGYFIHKFADFLSFVRFFPMVLSTVEILEFQL